MKILAVDFGDARTGLACCDRTEFLASPIGVIQERKFENVVQQVAYAAVEYEAGEIVVGHPLNMNGSAGPRAKLCEAFAEALSERSRFRCGSGTSAVPPFRQSAILTKPIPAAKNAKRWSMRWRQPSYSKAISTTAETTRKPPAGALPLDPATLEKVDETFGFRFVETGFLL